MKINIVIPMKDPQYAKQRLASVLSLDNRKQLALSMFKQTLHFLQHHFSDYPVLVVTNSKLIEDIASRYGADVLIENQVKGLNNAARLAAQWSCVRGFEAQLLLPADIAVLDESELQHLLAQRRDKPWVSVCPATDGGTNALMTSPPDAIPFCFGAQSSCAHLDVAVECGVQSVLIPMQHLAFDVDRPQDLEQLMALSCGGVYA